MTPEQFDQEYLCSFEAAILGAYYGKELAVADREGRIYGVPLDGALPVHTAWDLGVSDSTAIWFFQILHGGVHVIDYYEASGHGAEHYAQVLRDRGYAYGDHWIPHDGKVREWGSGKTRVEQLLANHIRPKVVPDHRVADGINAGRMLLNNARFDAEKCALGIEALRQYRTEYDEKKRTFKESPRHDWTSHAADAWRYLAMAHRELKPEPAPKAEQTPSLKLNVQAMLRMQDQMAKVRKRI